MLSERVIAPPISYSCPDIWIILPCLWRESIASTKSPLPISVEGALDQFTLLLFWFNMALVAVGGDKCAAFFAVAGAAEFAFIHGVHLHRRASLHRPDLRMAFLAGKSTAVEVVAERDRSRIRRFIDDVFRHRHLCMALGAIAPVRRFLAVMADKTGLILAVVRKGDLGHSCLHRENGGVARVAFHAFCMCFMLEGNGSVAFAQLHRFRAGHAGMTIVTVRPVGRFLSIVTREAGLVLAMVCKGDLGRSGLHREESGVADAALNRFGMGRVIEVDRFLSLAHYNRLVWGDAVRLAVAGDAVFIGRRLLAFFAFRIMTGEADIHAALITDYAAMSDFEMAVYAIKAHFKVLAVLRVNIGCRTNAFRQDVRKVVRLSEFWVFYPIELAEGMADRHDSLGADFLVHAVGMAEHTEIIPDQFCSICRIGRFHEYMHPVLRVAEELAVNVRKRADFGFHVAEKSGLCMTVKARNPGFGVFGLFPGCHFAINS